MTHKSRSFYFLAFLLSISFLFMLMQQMDQNDQLSRIIKSGELKVSTTNSEDTYFLSKSQPAGFEYDLVSAFAQSLGLTVRLNMQNNLTELEIDLLNRDSHISIPGRSSKLSSNSKLEKSTSYTHNQTVVIYRETRGKKYPREVSNIINRSIIVKADSPQELRLQKQWHEHPDLNWTSTTDLTTYEILERILNKQTDIAVISLKEFKATGPFFPGLKAAFNLGEAQTVHWLVANKDDSSLIDAVNLYLSSDSGKSTIEKLEQRYYSNDNPLNFFDTIAFKNDFNTRLPGIEPFFKQAALNTDTDWHLLAAIAYQESHWNPKAVSPTGVKGIMMLTKAAAKEVNVTDRTDPEQSILGGAQYLLNVKKKIPQRITDPDRTFLALAGYNTGFGHLEDARILAKRAGLNPDSWDDVKTKLPLLTKPEFYKTVKYGYARGYEPVNYVKNIRKYLTVLKWEIQQQQLKDTIQEPIKKSEIDADKQKDLEEQNAPSTL